LSRIARTVAVATVLAVVMMSALAMLESTVIRLGSSTIVPTELAQSNFFEIFFIYLLKGDFFPFFKSHIINSLIFIYLII